MSQNERTEGMQSIEKLNSHRNFPNFWLRTGTKIVVNADSTTSTGQKRCADESVGYLAGDKQMAMKEQQIEGNYEAGGHSQSLDASRRNVNYIVNASLI